jgi:WD40 repeat protein
MTIDRQGTRLIYGQPKGDVFIAELPTMDDIVALKDSPENFSTLQFSPDGAWVVGCSEKGEVKVWRSETGDLAQNLRIDGNASSVCFSSDGKRLIMALARGRVIVWDASATPWQEKRMIEQRLNCLGAKIGGELSRGLKETRDGTTFKEWLLSRGAEFVAE